MIKDVMRAKCGVIKKNIPKDTRVIKTIHCTSLIDLQNKLRELSYQKLDILMFDLGELWITYKDYERNN